MTKMLKVVGASWLQTKISSYILGTLAIMAIMAIFAGEIERSQEDGNYAATVYWSKNSNYQIEYWGQNNDLERIARGAARGYYRLDIDNVGWSKLEIETNSEYADDIQAHAAGMLEGALTWQQIHAHITNTAEAACAGAELACQQMHEALDMSAAALRIRAAKLNDEDPFWHQVYLFYCHIDGLYDGFHLGAGRSREELEIKKSDLYWLNLAPEIVDIAKNMNITLAPSFEEEPALATAFLRVVADGEIKEENFKKQLFVAQNAAGRYGTMMRILKRYQLNYHETNSKSPLVPGTSSLFTGHPGVLASHDHFYLINGTGQHPHLLAVTGTPILNFNNKLWNDINIVDQVPLGLRIIAANRLATNVSSWGHLVARNNSGTGCRQWLVVDYTKLDQVPKGHGSKTNKEADVSTYITIEEKNKEVRHTTVHRNSPGGKAKGLLWLVEQVPGRTHSGDLSDALLDRGQWATFGLPFFKDTAEITQTDKMEQLCGKMKSLRSQIFKASYKNATTVDTIEQLMRLNNITMIDDFNSDLPLTNEVNGDAMTPECILLMKTLEAAPGARADLTKWANEALGVIDTKVACGTSNGKITEFTAISSPPFTAIKKTETKNSTFTNNSLNKGNVAITKANTKTETPEKTTEKEIKKDSQNVIEPFQWSKSKFAQESHEGLPDIWNFETVKPVWFW